MPLTQLKIDRSFAEGLASNPRSRAIVGTTVALARQLDLECIIEGIETAEQEAIARSLGLRLMQGFYFSRPVRALEALNGARDGWESELAVAG
jgi:EAL domain-containing protein (putative c-di-GMP-specific phosphodiesterase class I)